MTMFNRQDPKFALEFGQGSAKLLRRGSDLRWRVVGRTDVEAINFAAKMRQFRENVGGNLSQPAPIGVFMPNEDAFAFNLPQDSSHSQSEIRATLSQANQSDARYEYQIVKHDDTQTATLVYFDPATLDEAESFIENFGFQAAYFTARKIVPGREIFPKFRHRRKMSAPVLLGGVGALGAILLFAWLSWPSSTVAPDTPPTVQSSAATQEATQTGTPELSLATEATTSQTSEPATVSYQPVGADAATPPTAQAGILEITAPPTLAPDQSGFVAGLNPDQTSSSNSPNAPEPSEIASSSTEQVASSDQVASAIKRPTHRPDSFQRVPLGPSILIPRLRPDNLTPPQPDFDTAGAIENDLVNEAIAADAAALAAGSALATGVNQRPPKQTAAFQSALNQYRARKSAAALATEGAGNADALTADDQVETRASSKFNKRALSLVGIYGTSKSRVVMFRTAGGSYRKIKIGQSISGWKLIAVGESSVRIQKGNQDKTLRMPD